MGTTIRNSGQLDGSVDTLEEHKKYATTTTETRKTIIKEKQIEKSQQESTKEIESESRNEALQPESKSTSRKVWAETVNSEYQKFLPPSHNVP